MKVSFIIVSHNRCERLLATLTHLAQTMPDEIESWETWVVDNGSTDFSAEHVAREFPEVHVIRRRCNEGVWARNYAIGRAAGEYIVLLDDDSYPVNRTVARSVEYLDQHDRLGAVVGRVVLPDGGLEACAMPCVLLSGAVCIRRTAIEEVGGFRREFFRKAGEYDLSFRLLDAGWGIERFEDLIYRHDKFSAGRSQFAAHRMDVRNNQILVERYLPSHMRGIYRADWIQRYAALARHDGQRIAARVARLEATWWRTREALHAGQVLQPTTVELIFQWRGQARAVKEWATGSNLRSVVIGDYGKNLYATYRACSVAGLQVQAISDNHPAFSGLHYRGIPVLPDEKTRSLGADGIVLSTLNPAMVARRAHELASTFGMNPLTFWSPRSLSPRGEIDLKMSSRTLEAIDAACGEKA